MSTTAMDYENANGDRFDDDGPSRYERDNRSASPRGDNGDDGGRRRSASPSGLDDRSLPKDDGKDDEGSINPGSNLFVTGIHPRLTEQEVTRLFEKYGEVEKCQIMRDPHTKESRGFGFVKMVTSDQADAAKEGLQGEQIEGRTLTIEKARRARPRTPTPGKYFGPPKREGRGGGRFDDRRPRGGYGGGGYGRSEDPYRYRNYERRYEDRGGYERGAGGGGGYERGPSYERGGGGYERGGGGYRGEDRGYDRGYREERGAGYERRERDDGYGRVDRYAGGREERERYPPRSGAPDERRGPGYDRERPERGDREGGRPRDGPPAGNGYGDSAPRPEGREPYGSADRNLR